MLRNLYCRASRHCCIAASIASLPAIAQDDGNVDDLGVMSINLKDVVKPPLVFKAHRKAKEHLTNQVLVGSCLSLLATITSGVLWYLLLWHSIMDHNLKPCTRTLKCDLFTN